MQMYQVVIRKVSVKIAVRSLNNPTETKIAVLTNREGGIKNGNIKKLFK